MIRSKSMLSFLVALGLAAGGLSADKEPRPLAELQRPAQSEQASQRRQAAWELRKHGPKAMPALLRLLEDRDAGVRLGALEAVKEISSGLPYLSIYGDETIGLVLLPLDDDHLQPRWDNDFYAKLLGGKAEAVRARLEKLEQDPDARVRALARGVLRRMKVRLAAAEVKLKQGWGKALRQDPTGQSKVAGKELQDASGKRLARLSTHRWEALASWSFSADGRLLAVGISFDSRPGDDKDYTIRGYLRLYDAQSGELLGYPGGLFGPVTHLAFSRDGKTLLYQTGKYKEVGGN
jgi:hypothetical protein